MKGHQVPLAVALGQTAHYRLDDLAMVFEMPVRFFVVQTVE